MAILLAAKSALILNPGCPMVGADAMGAITGTNPSSMIFSTILGLTF